VDESAAFDAQLRDAFEPAYVLERELTGGGMSRVFLATERALNRKVVIKVLPPELAAGVNRERFRREIQLAAQLQHPHIVPLYAAGEHGDLLYYTMPFIEGESLKHAIGTRGTDKPFSMREVVRILHDVSDALAYAHARGVIHRDIKPGNVLRSGVHAVVTDFGVAKAISASMPATGMTTSGMAIGTPAYMAPEQLAGDPAADHRVDIYAVGLLGYELLTGEAPFNETSPQATLAAQMTREPVSVSRKRPDAPPALAALVMKCLAKIPERRPQHATELVAELDAMAIGSGDFARSVVPGRRRGAALTALAVVAVAIVLARRGQFSGSNSPGSAPLAKADSESRVPKQPVTAPVPLALTHAESLAIAKSVERRMADRTAAAPKAVKIDSVTLAQIRSDVEKSVLDSLQKIKPPEPGPGQRGLGTPPFAGRRPQYFSDMTKGQVDSIVRASQFAGDIGMRFADRGGGGSGIPPRGSPLRASYDARATNMGPPRRIVVADPPPDARHQAIEGAGTQLMDALRNALGANPRYVVISRDSTAAALHGSRNRDSVMHSLNADMNASIRGYQAPSPDSVRWIITLVDPTSQLRSQTVSVGPVTLGATASLADSVAQLAARALWQLDHMPRRDAPAAAPSPPAPPTQPTPVKKP
jgi:tRNA A-37 threonylcarbamoyl transferase component Bud32